MNVLVHDVLDPVAFMGVARANVCAAIVARFLCIYWNSCFPYAVVPKLNFDWNL